MLKRSLPALAVLLAATGCATPVYVSPVEVNRFVAPDDTRLGQGTITIAPAPGTEDSLEFASSRAAFYAAVRDELAQLGYRPVADGGAQVAQVTLRQSGMEPADDGRRGPVSVGGGASTGTFGSGLGVGLGIDLTPRQADRVGTMLAVAIRSAEGGTNLWEGRASMTVSTNSNFAAADAAAARLAAALFEGFPGESGETIAVE